MKRIHLLLGTFLLCTLLASAQDTQSIVEETVTHSGVQAKIEFFASDEMAGRDTPSEEQRIAAKYLATRMKEWGIGKAPGMESYLQEVKFKNITPPESGSFVAKDSTYALGEDILLLDGAASNVEAKVIFLDYGNEEDFEKANVKDKIVVVRLGAKGEPNVRKAFGVGREKRNRAAEKGALALIELYTSKQISWNIIKRYLGGPSISLDMDEEEESGIPHLWLNDSFGTGADFFEKLKKAQLNIEGAEIERFTAPNVIGYVEGANPDLKDEIVVYSAHYDHVGVGNPDAEGDTIYNGTRDNCIGTITVLEAAHSIVKHPLDRSALFIFFTAEEKGLLGSKWYVEHPVMPLKDVVMCFNSDNAGYNDTELTTIIGLNRTTASEAFITAGKTYGLETIPDQMPEQNLFDRSDQVSFAKKGVPAVMFTMGITSFDDEILKYYHQAGDNPDSVDYDYLYKFTKTYVHACRLVGNMPERPYWTEGDKYYEAGEGLYKEDQ
ncbi:MAG: M28 family peptidase [Bacteroidota bacterium]